MFSSRNLELGLASTGLHRCQGQDPKWCYLRGSKPTGIWRCTEHVLCMQEGWCLRRGARTETTCPQGEAERAAGSCFQASVKVPVLCRPRGPRTSRERISLSTWTSFITYNKLHLTHIRCTFIPFWRKRVHSCHQILQSICGSKKA